MLLRRLSVLLALAIAAAMSVGVTAAPSRAAGGPSYAPLNRPGPRLSVPAARLRASMQCHGDPRRGPEPVLLDPATTATPQQNYSWNYELAFDAQHRYWCAVTMPYHTTGDIQTVGEYLVHGIRVMHQRTGRRIGILGHSQGGMSMRWALRFWPDTRAMVDDVIGMAGTNHGSTAFGQACLAGLTTCAPAMWQQRAGSAFVKALNSRAETFKDISYTEIYTHLDEVVTPTNGPHPTSALSTGAGRITNVAVQSICPAVLDEHVTIGTIDPVAYALVMDALDHRGPAVPSRIDRSKVCGRLYMPYVDPTNVSMYLTVLQMLPGLAAADLPVVDPWEAPMTRHEPALRCYVYAAGCAR
ncbi:MAG: lipase [Nocardioidaceae bacterium]|nr:lipase [Nocardioidaceae bacterium]MCL2611909.1 lipase [Nocardioidaceae bacterium]